MARAKAGYLRQIRALRELVERLHQRIEIGESVKIQAGTIDSRFRAMAHLSAALRLNIDKDGQVIMGHVRDAFKELGGRS